MEVIKQLERSMSVQEATKKGKKSLQKNHIHMILYLYIEFTMVC